MASRQPPFFYHILINPSSPHLPLPTNFVKKHLRNKILKDPILRSANGGYSWKLKMKKFDDGDGDHSFCFVNGWSKVVKDVGLLFGEFLLFRYVGYSVFSMHVYSVNGCEKILVPKVKAPRTNVREVSVEDEVVFDDDDVEDEEEEEDDDDVEYKVRDYVEEDDEDADEDEEDDDDDDVEFGDDGDEDDGEDEDVDVDVDGNDGDPFFIMTSSKKNKYKLRFPPELVALTKINNKETITLKNDDGYEKQMPVRSDKQNKSKRYYVTEGWKEFQQSNDISEGDECVFKFITSEDKLCLAKVTKKKTRATEVDNDDMDDDDDGMDEEGKAEAAKDDDFIVDGDDIFDDDGMDEEGEGEDVKLVDNDDEDDSVDGDEGDPSFMMTSSNTNQYKLPFPADFVALAGISSKETIILKNLDGYEKEFPVRLDKQYSRTSYYLGAGWKEFQRNTNISNGDKFVVKFITSEDKFCLAKVTKKRTHNNDMDDDDGMDEEGEAEAAKDDDFIVDGDDILVDDGIDDVDEEGEGEDVKLVDDDDEDDYVDGDDGDPFFIYTSSNSNQYSLWFPTNFVALAGINTKETITLKNLDGYEKELPVRSRKHHKLKHLTQYYLGAGWKEFQRNTNISEGDKFVFKFITSEDKFCVAKITKKKTRARPLPPAAEAPVTEVDDGIDDKDVDDNDVKDVDEDDELFDDGNPSFVATITPTYNRVLRMPTGFGELAGFDTKETLTLKGLDGYEKKMPLRVDQKRYYVGMGWKDILQSTSISEGDKCVFKFITSEDKLCLAKIIKKETRARPQLPAAEGQETEFNDDDTEDDEDVEDDNDKDENEDVERVDDGIDDDDDNDKDENEDVEPVDVDPFFVVNITTSHKYMLRLPPEFVELAGIDGKKNIIIKCPDGNERQMVLRPVKQGQSTRYCLSMGWLAFKRSNNISEGDEWVFKYIKSEDKMCLEKITKKVDGIDDKDVEVNDSKVDDENVELVDDGMDEKDVNGDDNKDEDENVELVDDGMDDKDVNGDDNKDEHEKVELVDDGNPFFVVTITPTRKLRLPTDFVALAGIESKENIIMKSLDENETQMSLRTDKRFRLTQYHLSVGWSAFKRSNNISDGDECVFKYITSEDKMCLAKVTKEKTSARPPPLAVGTPPTEVDDNDLNVDDGMDGKDVVVDDNKDEDENVELVDDGMDDKDVNDDDNKDEDENVELVDDGMDDKDVNGDGNKDEDENVELVGDGMDDKVVNGDDNKDEDENVELVDDGMNDKDVNGDDNKDEDENFELVDDGLDGKDVVVDDNKDEDENVEFAEDGMDVDADDNKDEDNDVELVDGNPFFVVTITPSDKAKLRLPPAFVDLARIDGKKNIIIKCPDGNERQMVLRSVKQGHLTQYYLSMGWSAFRRSNNISKGDECVFKYIASEDKMCLAKITKKETRARPPPPATETPPTEVDDSMDDEYAEVDDNKDKDENVELVDDGMDDNDVNEYVKLVDGMDDKDMEFDNNNHEDENENENVKLVDDGMDDKDVDEYVKLVDGMDNKDEDENVELVDDMDPFFRVTITPNHKSILRLPTDFVGLAGINTKKNIIVKSLDGDESQMAVRSDKRFNSLQYHLAKGWEAFMQRNNLSQGDDCVFKYITSEDKMCLAKVIKTSATEVDADPYFVVTITPCHKSMLWLPTDFVGLAGIDTKENVTVKSLDGNETQMALRPCPVKNKQSIRYRLTTGWPAFKRSNNISEGDECVFRYITSEDKLCLAKVTKEKTQTRLPSPAEVVKRKRGQLPPVTVIKMTAAETVKMRSRRPPPVEITVAEAVKRKRGQPPPSSPRVTKDMKRKKGQPHVHSAEGVEVTKKPHGRPAK